MNRMRTSKYLILIIPFILSSCGGADCSCEEIVKKDKKYYRTGIYKEGDRASFGEIFSGICETKYASGQVKIHQEYSNGIKHGLHSEYYDNSNLKEETVYNEGKRISKKEYYESGQLKSDIQFVDEFQSTVVEGYSTQVAKNYKFYYESGELKEEKSDDGLKKYNKSGDLIYEVSSDDNYRWEMLKDDKLELSRLEMSRKGGNSLMYIDLTGDEGNVLIGTIYVGVRKTNITKEDVKAFYSKVEGATDRNLNVQLEPWDEYYVPEATESYFNSLLQKYNKINILNLGKVVDVSKTQDSTIVTESAVSDVVKMYKIQDPDGYSNLRKTPGGEVLQKVYDGELFEVLGEENKHKKVKLSDGTVGYIHVSRVVKNN